MLTRNIIYVPLLAVFCIGTIFSQTTWAGVAEMNQNMGTTGKSSSPQNTVVQEKGGSYETNVAILSSEALFVRAQFEKSQFDFLLNLIIRAKAFENLQSFVTTGRVSKSLNLVQNTPLVLGNKVILVGDSVVLEDLVGFWQSQLNQDWLWAELLKAGILDKDGRALGVQDTLANHFSEANFQKLHSAIQKMDLGVTTTDLADNLRRDLYAYILNEHQVLKVTQQQTTRYNSAGKDFFGSIIDSIGGNIMGAIFHPDKTQTTQQKKPWDARTTVDPYFSRDFSLGFLPYPYFARNQGMVGVKGHTDTTALNYAGGSFNDGVSYFSLSGIYRNKGKLEPITAVGFFDLGAKYTQLADPLNTIKSTDFFVGVGGAGTHFMLDLNVGLSYLNGTKYDSLGILYGFSGYIYPINPISFDMQFLGRVQPNLFSDKKTNWEYNEFGLGASVSLWNTSVRLGYQWLFSGEKLLNEGATFGVQYAF